MTRVVDAVFLSIGAREQVALPTTSPAYTVNFPSPSSPGYWGVVSNWDGQWYRSIAETGYPAVLPSEDGQVVQNEWAFYPAYPMLVRVAMMLTSWEFGPAAAIVSLSCSGLAVVLLYRLLLRTGDRFVAGATVLCLCTYPTAPVFQVGYSEGSALLIIVHTLSCLHHRRYGWVAASMVALSLTRPLVLPFAAVIAAHWIIRFRRTRVEAFPSSERRACAAAAVVAVLSAGLWPIIAAIATGQADAFTATQRAWLSGQSSQGLWANWVFTAATHAPIAVLVIVASCALALIVTRAGAKHWGMELRTWSIAYTVYLLIATRPTASIFRYLMLAIAPLWPMPQAGSPSETMTRRTIRWSLLVVIAVLGLAGQYVWVTRVFTIPDSPQHQFFP